MDSSLLVSSRLFGVLLVIQNSANPLGTLQMANRHIPLTRSLARSAPLLILCAIPATSYSALLASRRPADYLALTSLLQVLLAALRFPCRLTPSAIRRLFGCSVSSRKPHTLLTS